MTAYALLGLLSFGRELSGYDLKKWADASLRFFYWSPATSQIYAELKRLEQRGMVSSREAPQDDLRNKRLYRITPRGRDELARWVEDAPVEPPVLKHSVVMRVWLGHLADPERLRAIVEEHRDEMAALVDDARRSREGARADESWVYPEIVVEWAERHYEAERAAAEQLLQDLAAVDTDRRQPARVKRSKTRGNVRA
jgi:DNA-binding PadR family transcriptional regulator